MMANHKYLGARDGLHQRVVPHRLQLGLAALALAGEIRETYGIPQRDYGNWRPKDTLEAAIAAA